MLQLKDLKLYSTSTHPCSYLDDQTARTLFVDPEASISCEQHTRLSQLGFRRSGNHYYIPFCDDCQACIPCRVKVKDFSPGRGFRRILKRNQDLSIRPISSIATREHYDLYQRYINTRHRDGDMYPATPDQYNSFLISRCSTTRYYQININASIAGIIINDELDDGLSAVYTFYDPDMSERSLGTFAILWQIERARELGFDYLYLGYWIKQSDKMNYKSRYRPLQVLIKGNWQTLT
jgi:arginine-tRNA-protein transferase